MASISYYDQLSQPTTTASKLRTNCLTTPKGKHTWSSWHPRLRVVPTVPLEGHSCRVVFWNVKGASQKTTSLRGTTERLWSKAELSQALTPRTGRYLKGLPVLPLLAPLPKPGTFPLFFLFSLQSSDVLLKADECIFFVHVYTQGRSSAGTVYVGEPCRPHFSSLPRGC